MILRIPHAPRPVCCCWEFQYGILMRLVCEEFVAFLLAVCQNIVFVPLNIFPVLERRLYNSSPANEN